MNRTAVTRSYAVIAALVILATGFTIREARADRLQQRWMLPRNTAEFTYARLGPPYGVAVDGQGNVYIADTSNQRVVCYARQWDAITPVLHLLLLGQ